MQNYYNAIVDYFEDVKKNKGQNVSLASIFNRIKSGSLANGDDDQAYRDFKANALTAFTPAGVFSPIRRNVNIQHHTGLIVLDYDHISYPMVVKDLGISLPHTVGSFISPSGNGVKFLISVDPVPVNSAEHRVAWATARALYDEAVRETIDESGKDCARLTFLAYDPEVYGPVEATPLTWEMPKQQQGWTGNEAWNGTGAEDNTDYLESSIEDSIRFLCPATDYNAWLNEISLLKSWGYSLEEADAWCRKGSKYQQGELGPKWAGLPTCGKEEAGKKLWAAAVSAGWEPPKQQNQAGQYDFAGNVHNSSPDIDYAQTKGAHFGVGGAEDDIRRAVYYYPNKLVAASYEGKRRALIAPASFWQVIRSERPTFIGHIKEWMDNAREAAIEQARQIQDTKLWGILREYTKGKTTTRAYNEIIRTLDHFAEYPQHYNGYLLDTGNLDRRDLSPVFPLRTGGSWDFRIGQEIDDNATRDCFLLDHQWEGAKPDFKLLPQNGGPTQFDVTVAPPNADGKVHVSSNHQYPQAAIMAWFIHGQIGTAFMRRLAYLIKSPVKEIDCLIMPNADAGKTTLTSALSYSLGAGAVEIMHGRTSIGSAASNERGFSMGKEKLRTAALVMIDEADKVDKYPSDVLNDACDDVVPIHLKGYDRFNKRRTGNLIFIGADWPNIDFNVQGVEARIRNAHFAGNALPITSGTREALLSPQAIGYLAAWLLDEGGAMYYHQDDGTNQQGKDYVAEWREAVSSPIYQALKKLVQVSPGNKISGRELRTAIEEATEGEKLPGGKAWGAMVKRLFPEARSFDSEWIPSLMKKASGWENIEITKSEDV